jgi:hypothetical protein
MRLREWTVIAFEIAGQAPCATLRDTGVMALNRALQGRRRSGRRSRKKQPPVKGVAWREGIAHFRPSSKGSRIALAVGAIVALWGLLVLPSITIKHWFFLDDPTVFVMARVDPSTFWWLKSSGDTGRYVPFYGLYRCIVYALVGESLPGFYGIQAGVILVTALLLFELVRRLTERFSAGTLAAALFLTGSPVAENAYTTGKGEPLQLLFFGGLLLGLLAFARAFRLRAAAFALGGVALLQVACLWAKETGIIAWPLSVAFAIFIVLLRGTRPIATQMKRAGALLAVSISTLVAAKAFQVSVSASGGPGTYVGDVWRITPHLVFSNLRFYVVQLPDFVPTVVAILLLLPAGWKKAREGNDRERLAIAFAASTMMAGCGYVAGMCAWRWPLGYYLYPASGLLSVAAALLLGAAAPRGPRRVPFLAAVTALAVGRLVSLPYAHYIATSQAATARVYSAAVTEFARLAPQNARLFVETWGESSEAIWQTNLLFRDLLGRPDVSVHSRIPSGVTDPTNGGPLVPRPGDFLLSIRAYKPALWMLRGVLHDAFDRSPNPLPDAAIRPLAHWEVTTSSLYIDRESKRPRWGETWVAAQLFLAVDN